MTLTPPLRAHDHAPLPLHFQKQKMERGDKMGEGKGQDR